MATSINPEDIRAAFRLPAKEAVAFLSQKGYSITWSWEEMEQIAHAKAFTVAKAMNIGVLQTIRAELQKAIDDGTTKEDFQKALEPRLTAAGWWGKKELEDPATGEKTKVELGSPRRLENIYRTNVQSAYSAGRFQQQVASSARRPYWRYRAVSDSRSRPSHQILDGKIVAASDPWWKSHYPPNGYLCRCRVETLSERELQRDGLTVSDPGSDPDIQLFAPDKGFQGNPAGDWTPDLSKVDPDLAGAFRKAVDDNQKKTGAPEPEPAPEPLQKKDPDQFLADHQELADQTKERTRQLVEADMDRRKEIRKEIESLVGEIQKNPSGSAQLLERIRALELSRKDLDAQHKRDVEEAKKPLKEAIWKDFQKKRPATFQVPVKGKPSKAAMKAEAEEGINWIRSVVGEGVIDAVPVSLDWSGKRTRGRAFYAVDTKEVVLSPGWKTEGAAARTTVHELAHHLEYHIPGLQARALDFLAKRTQGEKPRRLSDIYKGHGYGKSEIALEDRFWSAYVGRLYPTRAKYGQATEIISMGVERLYHDPAGFMIEDPDYVRFLYDVLGGT